MQYNVNKISTLLSSLQLLPFSILRPEPQLGDEHQQGRRVISPSVLLSAHCLWLLQCWQGQKRGQGCSSQLVLLFSWPVLSHRQPNVFLGDLLQGPSLPCHFWMWAVQLLSDHLCRAAPVLQWYHWSIPECLSRQSTWVETYQDHSNLITSMGSTWSTGKVTLAPSNSVPLSLRLCCLALRLQAASARLEGSILTHVPLSRL